MHADHGISRRRMLEMVGAGGLALAGGARLAWAQSAKRIERLAPELDAIIDTSQSIRELATGFGKLVLGSDDRPQRRRVDECAVRQLDHNAADGK